MFGRRAEAVMGDERGQSSGGLPAAGILWLALLGAGALFLHQVPWQGSRPLAPEPKAYGYAAQQDVDARLWQDPLGAVARGREEARKRSAVRPGQGTHQLGHRAVDLACTIRNKRYDGEVLVMGVMASGGPYPEYAEFRRRARYAILAGLNETGFVPDDAEHLGYFEPEAPSGTQAQKAAARLPEFIAYEWLHANGSDHDVARPASVLILWLDEDVLGSHMLVRLDRVASDLRIPSGGARPPSKLVDDCDGKAGEEKPVPTPEPRFAVLGPGSTASLQDMVAEASKEPPHRGARRMTFYAYGATADDAHILADVGSGGAKEAASVHDFFRQRNIALFRTIGTDKALAEQLQKELAQRKVDPAHNRVEADCPATIQGDWQHVLLIAEWDTFYGRSLPRTMAKELGGPDRCRGHGPDDYPPWIHAYSYLRGLDGQLPTTQTGGDAGAATKDGDEGDTKARGASGGGDEKRIERAEGQGQLDYLRRLGDQLLALDHELRAHRRGTIRAIGVLGSDVYDKLLILQALRAQFPNALFFTTDLDTRMLHPQQLDWTRNAIVASSFGLRLAPDLQRDIPPFRDSYQTSLYLSAMVAMNHARHVSCDDVKASDECACFGITQADLAARLDPPRIFEIGRKVEFDFSSRPTPQARTACTPEQIAGLGSGNDPPTSPGWTACTPGQLAACSSVHPPPSSMYPDPPPGSLQHAFRLLVGGLLLLGLATGTWSQLASWITHG